MHTASDVTLPRPQTHSQPEKLQKSDSLKNNSHPPDHFSKFEDEKPYKNDKHLNKFLFTDRQPVNKQKSSEREKFIQEIEKNVSSERRRAYIEDEWLQSYKKNHRDESNRFRHSKEESYQNKYNYDEPKYFQEPRVYKEPPVPKVRQKLNEDSRYHSSDKNSKQRILMEEIKCYNDKKMPRPQMGSIHSSDRESKPSERSSRSKYSHDDYLVDPDMRKRPEHRQRSPSPVDNITPRDRFKDAKEKFLLMEKERIEEQERVRKEIPISPVRKERHFMKRHESMAYPSAKDRFDRYEKYDGKDKERYYEDNVKPEPAPRNLVHDNVRYRKDIPMDRYRNVDKYDPKRRSMFSLIEEEHRKNSNEIAKELKRRSYMENNNYEEDFYRERDRERAYTELPESDRYSSIERDRYHYSKSTIELDKVGEMKYDPKFLKNQKVKNAVGYRHSYAEPKLKLEKNSKKHYPEMLHRTNSTVSNSGRVGIASVHPY